MKLSMAMQGLAESFSMDRRSSACGIYVGYGYEASARAKALQGERQAAHDLISSQTSMKSRSWKTGGYFLTT